MISDILSQTADATTCTTIDCAGESDGIGMAIGVILLVVVTVGVAYAFKAWQWAIIPALATFGYLAYAFHALHSISRPSTIFFALAAVVAIPVGRWLRAADAKQKAARNI